MYNRMNASLCNFVEVITKIIRTSSKPLLPIFWTYTKSAIDIDVHINVYIFATHGSSARLS